MLPTLRQQRLSPFWGANGLADLLERPDSLLGYRSPRECDHWHPVLEVTEHEAEFVVRAELPGIDHDAIGVSVNEGHLVLQGESKADGDQTWTERRYGKFYRSFHLPAEVDEGSLEATYKDGILTVVLPKTEVGLGTEVPVKFE